MQNSVLSLIKESLLGKKVVCYRYALVNGKNSELLRVTIQPFLSTDEKLERTIVDFVEVYGGNRKDFNLYYPSGWVLLLSEKSFLAMDSLDKEIEFVD